MWIIVDVKCDVHTFGKRSQHMRVKRPINSLLKLLFSFIKKYLTENISFYYLNKIFYIFTYLI